MTGTLQAGTPGGGTVVLTCEDRAATDPALCAAMMQALMERTPPGTDLRRNAAADPALRDGDIEVRFVLDRRDATGLAGHLEWRDGPGAAVRTAPQVGLDAMDAPLSPSMYAAFARGLFQVDPDLLSLLQPIARP